MGALKVVSCEPNKNIRYLRGENPWSREFMGERIESRQMRAEEFLEDSPSESFDCILHDPPRFSLAGELYSAEFYTRLADVLKPKGRLFHYTGNPYSHGRTRMFVEGVMRRLSEGVVPCPIGQAPVQNPGHKARTVSGVPSVPRP